MFEDPGAVEPALRVIANQTRRAPMFEESVDEYVPDITDNLFAEEQHSLPCPSYMDTQPEISPNMRVILFDWLVEVIVKHNMCNETLHLAYNIIDRYLSKAPVAVTRRRLQLVGVTASLIASKFEEMNPPELSFWSYITANAYTQDDITLMECTMLTTLSFQVMVPTGAHFKPIFEKVNGSDGVQSSLAEYLVELGLLDIRLLCYPPSHTVAAAILLSNELLARRPLWSCAMETVSRRTITELSGCVEVLRELHNEDCAREAPGAVRKKFSSAKQHSVATMFA